MVYDLAFRARPRPMLLRPHRLVVLAAFVGAGSIAASSWQCGIYGPDLLLAGDASMDVVPSSKVDGGRAFWPGRPDADSPSTFQNYTAVATMTSIDLGVGLDGGGPAPDAMAPLPPLGWDLDNVVTCPGPPSCVQATGMERCDDEAGRDHTGLLLFRLLGPTAQTGVAAVNAAMLGGEYGLVVQVTGYNGQPNDTQVRVALYFSSGVLGTGDAGDAGPILNHDGNDRWTIDPRSLVGEPTSGDCFGGASACQPNFSDEMAYVSDGVLVAQGLGEVPITFGGRANIGGAVMTLSQTVVVGTLVPTPISGNGQGWGIVNGSISGRWGSTKLLSNMATIPDPTMDSGAFLCGAASPAYQFLRNYICSLQDISTDPTSDNHGAPCDAISMSFGFTAQPAQLGAIAPIPATPAGCSQGGTPFHDSCQ
ncbi:MAG: hypothetical protein ACHQNA_13745 [Acidimicrobiales bacterium]